MSSFRPDPFYEQYVRLHPGEVNRAGQRVPQSTHRLPNSNPPNSTSIYNLNNNNNNNNNNNRLLPPPPFSDSATHLAMKMVIDQNERVLSLLETQNRAIQEGFTQLRQSIIDSNTSYEAKLGMLEQNLKACLESEVKAPLMVAMEKEAVVVVGQVDSLCKEQVGAAVQLARGDIKAFVERVEGIGERYGQGLERVEDGVERLRGEIRLVRASVDGLEERERGRRVDDSNGEFVSSVAPGDIHSFSSPRAPPGVVHGGRGQVVIPATPVLQQQTALTDIASAVTHFPSPPERPPRPQKKRRLMTDAEICAALELEELEAIEEDEEPCRLLDEGEAVWARAKRAGDRFYDNSNSNGMGDENDGDSETADEEEEQGDCCSGGSIDNEGKRVNWGGSGSGGLGAGKAAATNAATTASALLASSAMTITAKSTHNILSSSSTSTTEKSASTFTSTPTHDKPNNNNKAQKGKSKESHPHPQTKSKGKKRVLIDTQEMEEMITMEGNDDL